MVRFSFCFFYMNTPWCVYVCVFPEMTYCVYVCVCVCDFCDFIDVGLLCLTEIFIYA